MRHPVVQERIHEKLVHGANREAITLVLAKGKELGENSLKLFLVYLYPCQEDSNLLQLLMAVCAEKQVNADSRSGSWRR